MAALLLRRLSGTHRGLVPLAAAAAGRPQPSRTWRRRAKRPLRKLVGCIRLLSENFAFGPGEGEAARPAALVFKGGEAASLHKPKKHKKNKKLASDAPAEAEAEAAAPASAEGAEGGVAGAGDEYTIDAAKRMKYEELFPVESKKFGYDPANAARTSRTRTVEEALDDRVRKKADRYCK